MEPQPDKLTTDRRQRLMRHGHLPGDDRHRSDGGAVSMCRVIALAKARSASLFRRRFCRPARVGRRASRCISRSSTLRVLPRRLRGALIALLGKDAAESRVDRRTAQEGVVAGACAGASGCTRPPCANLTGCRSNRKPSAQSGWPRLRRMRWQRSTLLRRDLCVPCDKATEYDEGPRGVLASYGFPAEH